MTTVNIPGIELVKAGTWNASTGRVTITKADLADMAAASRDTTVDLAVIKLGHIDPRFDGEPALGRVTNLRLSSDGSTLIGDLVEVPSQLADILPSAYPRRSVEIQWGLKAPDGTRRGAVLTGLALLGVAPPAVKGLADVYKAAASDTEPTGHAVALLTDTSGVPLRDTPTPDPAGVTTPSTTSEDPMTQPTGAAPQATPAAPATPGTPTAPAADPNAPAGTAPATPTTDPAAPTAPAAPAVPEATPQLPVAAAAAPATGVQTVTLSQGQYDELVANGEAGKAALAQIDAQRRDGIIATALSEGRLAPADQATWRAQLDKDEPGTVALLSTLAAGTVPVTPIGHAHAAAGDPLEAEWEALSKSFTQEV